MCVCVSLCLCLCVCVSVRVCVCVGGRRGFVYECGGGCFVFKGRNPRYRPNPKPVNLTCSPRTHTFGRQSAARRSAVSLNCKAGRDDAQPAVGVVFLRSSHGASFFLRAPIRHQAIIIGHHNLTRIKKTFHQESPLLRRIFYYFH